MTSDPFLVRLLSGRVVVADGAWGTMLLDRGLPASRAPEWWTLERPDIISAIALEYVEAGAELVTTNTFGGSRFRLQPNGLREHVADVNRLGVEILRAAVGDRAYISSSIGPSGLLLTPHGDADPGEIRAGFEEQVSALASAQPDLYCVETMTDVEEAVLAVHAVRTVAPSAPVIATMTFDPTPRGPFTIMGVSVGEAARRLQDAGATAIGANCGTGIDAMLDVARAFRRSTPLPVAVRANAGLPQRKAGRLVYPDTPAHYAAAAKQMAALGVALIGGCCGTTPAHVRAVAAALRSPG